MSKQEWRRTKLTIFCWKYVCGSAEELLKFVIVRGLEKVKTEECEGIRRMFITCGHWTLNRVLNDAKYSVFLPRLSVRY